MPTPVPSQIPSGARQDTTKKDRMAQEIVGGKKGDQKSKRKADLRSCRRKAHHHFMAVTCSDLKPGINYHLRIAGINRVGQVLPAACTVVYTAILGCTIFAMLFSCLTHRVNRGTQHPQLVDTT